MNISQSVLRAAVILCLVSFEAGWLIVLVEVWLECEAFVAAVAGIVLEGGVCLHVGAQVWAVSKGFATVGTGKWFLSSVGPHVALQQPWSTEGFAAHRAFMLQVVGQHVHGQRWHRHVHLVAGGTFPGLLAVQATMSLLVSAQVGGRGIRLATLTTHVTPFGFHFGRAAVCQHHILAAVQLTTSLAGTPLTGSAAGASIRDEKCVNAASL